MTHRHGIALSLATTLMFALTACGGGGGGLSPREACDDSQAALCERLYTCYTAEELAAAGFPSSEAACTTMLQQSEGCAAQTTDNTCDGNASYHADQADDCVDQLAGLSCNQIRDENTDINVAAPACGRVCAVD
jgi:hypothetical protein